MSQKFNHGGATKKEYFEKWDRYVKFLESVGFVVTGFDPDISCYFKKDEYLSEDGKRMYNGNLCYRLDPQIVEFMMSLAKV